jgi:multicomponent Na+:H+ antiporter subunit C
MAYRSWQLTGHDEVQDDVEDAAIRRLASADAESRSYDDGDDDDDITSGPEARP